VNAALAYLDRNAKRLHVDASRIVLAGDSGGAHIAAQWRTSSACPRTRGPRHRSVDPAAPASRRDPVLRRLRFREDRPRRSIRRFMRTVLWSYFAGKDFFAHPLYSTASVTGYLTGDFPPAFISVGNADPSRRNHAPWRRPSPRGAFASTACSSRRRRAGAGARVQFNWTTPRAARPEAIAQVSGRP